MSIPINPETDSVNSLRSLSRSPGSFPQCGKAGWAFFEHADESDDIR